MARSSTKLRRNHEYSRQAPLNPKAGFTLLELDIVIGILLILFTTTIAAINPTKRIKQARDSARVTYISNIKVAIDSYVAVNGGQAPSCTISATQCNKFVKIDGDATNGQNDDALTAAITSAQYLNSMPLPPKTKIDNCNFFVKLYSKSPNYQLRWCYESLSESQTNAITANPKYNYYCKWDSSNHVAICYAGVDDDGTLKGTAGLMLDIPSP